MRLAQELSVEQQVETKQEQKLTMTPKLQQSIELLQLSSLELWEEIREEVMDNPLLELDMECNSFNSCGQAEELHYEKFATKQLSLKEYLLQQLNLVTSNKQEREIGEQIIGNLDDCGFFTEQQAVAEELEIKVKKVESVLERIKEIAPPGIGASGWSEALEARLEMLKDSYCPEKIKLAKQIVNKYLSELKKNNLKTIAQELNLDVKTVQELADLINNLNLSPKANFNDNQANSYLEPDIIIEKNGDNYNIIMSKKSFPTLRINKKYRRILNQKSSVEVQDYVENKLQSALWLIKSIEQRRQTIYSIVEELIDVQREFLESGVKALTPLSMAEVAEEIDRHESTVSRATDNKYVQTPYGLFPFKFFFSQGLNTSGGEKVSVVSVKKHLKEIINAEDKSSPLSDKKLAEKLKEADIKISRRTVAKYRKELGIPSSRGRKRYS